MTTEHTAEVPTKHEPPRLDELGDIVKLTNGSATDSTRDANAWYW